MAFCIRRCCELKADVVAADEKKQVVYALLNLDILMDTPVEAHMGYGVWLHGEAVAAGMVMAARNTQAPGQFTEEETQRVIQLLEKANLPVNGPIEMTPDDYLPHMMRDKSIWWQITPCFTKGIGQSNYVPILLANSSPQSDNILH